MVEYFLMGTLIQTVYETEAAELRMLGYLGCDVTTWGNHEFDYRSSGLANMLNTAKLPVKMFRHWSFVMWTGALWRKRA